MEHEGFKAVMVECSRWASEQPPPAFPVLAELATAYGADTQLDYVGDIWGNTACTLSPSEAINMHRDCDFSEEGYRVLYGALPGGAVLVCPDGAAILRLPE